MPVHLSPTSCASALLAAQSVRFIHGKIYQFASGIASPGAYNNNRVLPSHPQQWRIVVDLMEEVTSSFRSEFDVIASVATGGIAHGIALALRLQIPHFIVKKQPKGYGIDGLIDGAVGLLPRARVLMVEDMSSTFQSTLAAIPRVEHYNATVTRTLAISTWGFPEFYQKVGDRNVHVLSKGSQFVDGALQEGKIDDEYAALLKSWIENPHDERWKNISWQ